MLRRKRWGELVFAGTARSAPARDEEVQRVLMEKLFPRQATVVTSQEFIQALG